MEAARLRGDEKVLQLESSSSSVKDLTNNVELIRTMNKLGRGISYDVTQSLLTEVAYLKMDSTDGEQVLLPGSTEEETFAMLVEDNIDRLEETLSGK